MGDEINFTYKPSKIGNEFIAAYATVWNEPDNSRKMKTLFFRLLQISLNNFNLDVRSSNFYW